MRSIFISYRRDDAEGEAGRLYDDFAEHLGEDAVFMDVTGIAPGLDFRKVIDESVATCGVLLAIIGQSWTDAKDAAGARRLDDPGDFVRFEIASALKREIPVIPVLVHGARMPRAEHLPEDIRNLAYRNAVELAHARWASDFQLLLRSLRTIVPDLSATRSAGEAAVAAGTSEASPEGVRGVGPRSAESRGRRKTWLYAPAVLMLGLASYGAYSTFTGNPVGQQAPGRQRSLAANVGSTSPGSGDVLTYGTWTLTKAIDDEVSDWADSTLTFTSQKRLNDGFLVAGYFEWREHNVLMGREEVEGHYQPSQARIILKGKRIVPLSEGGRMLAPGSFSARLSADGRELVDGTWGTVEGADLPNVRARWQAAR